MNKVELGEEERLRTLETRTATWLRIAVVQQVLLVGLLAQAYFSYDVVSRLDARVEVLDARVEVLDARVEVVERSTATHAHQTRERLRQLSVAMADTQNQPSDMPLTTRPLRIHERSLQAAPDDDRAIIRVDAPDGRAQFVMGARAAADNVIMEKEHADEGGDFTLSRNLTRVLGIGVGGAVTVHTNPLYVASVIRSATGNPLHLQGHGGVNVQSKSSYSVQELDGQGYWSNKTLKVYVGDTITWSWTNYHNVIETDPDGSVKAGGISSGEPMIGSSFKKGFQLAGVYRFKSQTQFTMTCIVEVVESFVFDKGVLSLGGDLIVAGVPFSSLRTDLAKLFTMNNINHEWSSGVESPIQR